MTKIASPPSLPATVSCPKLPRTSRGYRYYAGYSRSFVHDILSRWPGHALVLDPWNGSGTTTTVAAESGLNYIGVDLNPVMVVVARAALLGEEEVLAIRRQACGLRELRSAAVSPNPNDPLLEWLDRPSVARFRALQTALIGSTRLTASDIADLGAVKAFWLTLLFHTVRKATKPWQSSNPTWVKSRRDSQPAKLFWRPTLGETYDAAMSVSAITAASPPTARIVLGTSTDLASYGIEPDVVLGSPPYCTRIDYAVATRVELSVLGFSVAEQLALRRALIGTTTVPPVSTILDRGIGVTARRTLDAIANHPSKASRTYYWKWFAQYLTGYAASLAQIAKVTSRTGTIGLVVQDSYYKEVHLDLPQITTDILAAQGWQPYHSYAFAPRRSFAQVNLAQSLTGMTSNLRNRRSFSDWSNTHGHTSQSDHDVRGGLL